MENAALCLDPVAQYPSAFETAKTIFAEFMGFRRLAETKSSCKDCYCPFCSGPHLAKVVLAVQNNEPVSFVLPAFPGKSPNQAKVLGPLPDYAEQLSLQFLADLAKRVKEYYSPGVKIILCSDGRVFSDVVGMTEENVTAYQTELKNMIVELALTDIDTFNLDDLYAGLNFDQMRTVLMEGYGSSLDSLKDKVNQGANDQADPECQEANRMYRGITRFLFEDALIPGLTKSRTAIQKESRSKAYEVIRRSNAWSKLIAERFPASVRLSIHPQSCGSQKLGIRLIGNETWMTPWHGVAVDTPSGFVLLKNSEAQALGAELVFSMNGRPSHYRLSNVVSLSKVEA